MPFGPGHEEDGFLRQLGVPPSEAEPLAANCTKVLVWHTQTRPYPPFTNNIDMTRLVGTNMDQLMKEVV